MPHDWRFIEMDGSNDRCVYVCHSCHRRYGTYDPDPNPDKRFQNLGFADKWLTCEELVAADLHAS